MLRFHRHRFLFAVMLALATFWPAIEAFAQQAPPQPSLQRSPPVWLGMGIMFTLFAMVVALNLMPSKRGHQD